MLRRMAWVFLMALMLSPAAPAAQSASREKAATAAAEKWLVVVDKGQYAESWQEAAAYFRNSITKQDWERAVQSVRKPLGNLISRKIKSAVYKTSLPGVPDGEYVVMQFNSSFTNKKSAVETVTTVLDKDGEWKAVGYFIR